MENSMEIIFRESAKALGQLTCQKLLNEVFKEEDVAKPKKAVAKKKEDDGAAAADTRWSRWTKTYTDTFKKCLTDAEIPHDEKEFDKLKKEFVKYLNDLTEEDYQKDTKTHPDRMKDFADLKVPKKEAPKKEAPKKEAKKKTMWEEMNTHEAPDHPPSNAANFHDVKLDDLRNNDMLITVEGAPDGVFWDGKTGRWIRGPDAIDDEDLVEQTFNKLVYEVGEKSARIYRFNEEKDRHEFVGYVGVGKFRDMKMP